VTGEAALFLILHNKDKSTLIARAVFEIVPMGRSRDEHDFLSDRWPFCRVNRHREKATHEDGGGNFNASLRRPALLIFGIRLTET